VDLKDIKLYVDDRPEEGAFRVHRDLFADAELFELEQKYIFERTWAFLAFESQLATPHDFIATHIGRVPVMVTRDASGKLGAFLNVCRHKGTMLARTESGNRKYHVCNYHGWAYDSAGKARATARRSTPRTTIWCRSHASPITRGCSSAA